MTSLSVRFFLRCSHDGTRKHHIITNLIAFQCVGKRFFKFCGCHSGKNCHDHLECLLPRVRAHTAAVISQKPSDVAEIRQEFTLLIHRCEPFQRRSELWTNQSSLLNSSPGSRRPPLARQSFPRPCLSGSSLSRRFRTGDVDICECGFDLPFSEVGDEAL